MSEALPSGPFGMYPHAFAAWHTKGCGINVAESDAEEYRQLRKWLPNVSQLYGKVKVTLQNILKGCRIVGDIMLKCGGVESCGKSTMQNFYLVMCC